MLDPVRTVDRELVPPPAGGPCAYEYPADLRAERIKADGAREYSLQCHRPRPRPPSLRAGLALRNDGTNQPQRWHDVHAGLELWRQGGDHRCGAAYCTRRAAW